MPVVERGLGPIIPTGCSPPSPRQRRISPPSFARLAMPRKRVVHELPGKTRVRARLIFEESCRSLNLHRLSELRYSLERNRRPSASNPRGQSRYMPDQLFASSFALLTILFRSLVACSHAAIFVGFPESFPTLLIASLLIWILCFVFFFHI